MVGEHGSIAIVERFIRRERAAEARAAGALTEERAVRVAQCSNEGTPGRLARTRHAQAREQEVLVRHPDSPSGLNKALSAQFES